MADDFDPDKFMASAGLPWPPPPKPASVFDPDQFMREQGLQMPETMRERERGVRQAIAAEPKNVPAGFAPAPVTERTQPMMPTTFAERAGQLGDVAIGAAKGVPAWVAGGELGDIEAGVRPFLHGVAPGTFSAQSAIPTTVEGGYLGPRGYDVLGAPANEYEAMGRGLTSMVMPNLWPAKIAPRVVGSMTRPGPSGPPAGLGWFYPAEESASGLPIAPKLTTPRTSNIGQRIGPDMLPPTGLPATAPAGAARISPLEGVDPEAIRQIHGKLTQSGFTPYTLDQTLEGMSPHQFALEVSDPMWRRARGINGMGGEAGMDVRNGLVQRAAEKPQRIQSILDAGLGANQDLSLLRRTMEIDRNLAADPLYQAFRDTHVTPTPELEALMPRLQAAKAFGAAHEMAGIRGVPWQESFDSLGAEGMTQAPTPESWDLVKRSLDDKIGGMVRAGEKSRASAFIDLKNDLVRVLDTHPEVGNIYQQARATFANSKDMERALDLGKDLATKEIAPDELPYLMAPFNAAQEAAVRLGFRNAVQLQLGRKIGPQAATGMVNKLLSDNNQANLRYIMNNDQAADQMISALNHEHLMHGSHEGMIHGSRTTPMAEDVAEVKPPPQGILQRGLAAAAHPLETAQEAAMSAVDKMRMDRAARLNNDQAKILLMQGPERDAVLRWILENGANYTGRKRGGRVNRATGGRVNAFVPPPNARKNPRDGQYYLPGKKPGAWLKVVPRA